MTHSGAFLAADPNPGLRSGCHCSGGWTFRHAIAYSRPFREKGAFSFWVQISEIRRRPAMNSIRKTVVPAIGVLVSRRSKRARECGRAPTSPASTRSNTDSPRSFRAPDRRRTDFSCPVCRMVRIWRLAALLPISRRAEARAIADRRPAARRTGCLYRQSASLRECLEATRLRLSREPVSARRRAPRTSPAETLTPVCVCKKSLTRNLTHDIPIAVPKIRKRLHRRPFASRKEES